MMTICFGTCERKTTLARLLVHLQQHDDRGFCQDSVGQLGRHVDQGAGLRVVAVLAQGERGFAAVDVDAGGHRRGVGGEFLARRETEGQDLHVVVIVKRAAQDSIFRDLDLFAEIADQGVVHTSSVAGRRWPGSDLGHASDVAVSAVLW